MLVTVKLYGHLRKRFGSDFEFDITVISEVINALQANLAGFKQHLIKHNQPGYKVIVDNRPVMDMRELGLCVGSAKVVKIIPVVKGASGKGIGQIILGVALIGLAAFGGVAAIAGSFGASAATASSLTTGVALFGASLLLGGISSLLSPVPKSTNSKQANNIGISPTNTIQQGQRIPIVYGKMLVEGLPISVKITVEQKENVVS